jgi:hypothetical protein
MFAYDPKLDYLAKVTSESSRLTFKVTNVAGEAVEAASEGLRIVVRESRLDFEAKSGMASAKFDYEYSKDLVRPSIGGRIGAKTLPKFGLEHGWTPEAVTASSKMGKFVIHPHDLNVTSITDGVAAFTISSHSDILTLQVN